MKFPRWLVGVMFVLAFGACRQGSQKTRPSLQPAALQTAASAESSGTGASSSNNSQASTPTALPGGTSAEATDVLIEANVDDGAQLLLVDAKGHKTGYDPAVRHTVEDIPGAAYTDESITDIADNSDDPAVGESRVLHIKASAGSSYLLHVTPTDRTVYRLGFRCKSGDGSTRIPAMDVGVSSGEEHLFLISASQKCSERFVTGALISRSQQNNLPLLSYASPTASTVHLAKGSLARLVILYDRDILPSSFLATLNGQVISQLFHPKPGSIESLVLPIRPGQNVVQLNVSSTRNSAPGVGEQFTLMVD